MAQRHCGLDIGTGAVKAVIATGGARGISVAERIDEPIEPGDELQWAERARAAVARLAGRIRADSVFCALHPAAAVVTRLNIAMTDPRKVAATVGFELEAHMPHELDAVVYDYRIVERREKDVEVGAVHAPRTEVASTLDLCAAAQIDPRCLVPPALAVKFAARLMDPERCGAGPYIVADVGARHTSICVVDERDVPFARSVRFGTGDIEAALGAAAEGAREAAAASAALVLVEHLRLSAVSYAARTRREVQAVFICGGGASVPGLAAFAAEKLQIRCETVAENVTRGAAQEDAGRFALAFALAAMSASGLRREVINLRKDEFAFKGEYKFLRGKVIQMGAAAAVVVALALGSALVKSHGLSSHEEKLDGRLHEVTKTLLGKPYEDYKIALSIVKQKISPQASPVPKKTALDYFNEVSVGFPEDLRIDLREFSIQSSKIRLEGDTESFEAVDKIVNGLKTNKCFEEINKGKVKKSPDGSKVEFDLTVTPKC
jgi:general secretion pathway protein L